MESSGQHKIPTRSSSGGHKLKRLELDLENVKHAYQKRIDKQKKSGVSVTQFDACLGNFAAETEASKKAKFRQSDIDRKSTAEVKQAWEKRHKAGKLMTETDTLGRFAKGTEASSKATFSQIHDAGDASFSKSKKVWEKRLNTGTLATETGDLGRFADCTETSSRATFGVFAAGGYEGADDNNAKFTDTKKILAKLRSDDDSPLLFLPAVSKVATLEYSDLKPMSTPKAMHPGVVAFVCAFLAFWFFLAAA
jgi:hypothetical protein